MIQVAIIIGSTRPGRNGEAVARWVHDMAQKRAQTRSDAGFELVDMRDFKPAARHEQSVNTMFDQVIAWGGALKTLRSP
jgi:NAD(P)H-dependent FMN reductase